MTNGTETRSGFLNRKITMRWALLFIEVALLLGLILWMLKAFELRRVTQDFDSALREQATQTAQVTARSIATFGNRQIVEKDWGALQEAADELVVQKPLAYVAIVDAKGIAVVHTDRSMRGRKLVALPESKGLVEASVPAMSATSQAGTVHVGVSAAPE
jgi:sensor histidine kinase regulating citrate/malate metabolism